MWILSPGESTPRYAYSDDVSWEQITCPMNPEHTRPGHRTTELTLIVDGEWDSNIIWSWMGDCLLSEDAILSLHASGIDKGLELRPATLISKYGPVVSRKFFEVRPSLGGALGESEHVISNGKCPICEFRSYSVGQSICLEGRSKTVKKYDFFFLWPLPKYIIVSNAAADHFMKYFGWRNFTPIAKPIVIQSSYLLPGDIRDYISAEKLKDVIRELDL